MSIDILNHVLEDADWKKAKEDLELLGGSGRNYQRNITVGYRLGAVPPNNVEIVNDSTLEINFPKNTNSSPYVFFQPVGINVLDGGTEYTVSFYAWFKASDIEDPPPTPFCHGLRYGGYDDQRLTLEYDKPVKITHIFTPTDVSGNLTFILFIPAIGKNDKEVQISNFKLEKGNKSTEWTLAPEDLGVHPFIAELAELQYETKRNKERLDELENATISLGGMV